MGPAYQPRGRVHGAEPDGPGKLGSNATLSPTAQGAADVLRDRANRHDSVVFEELIDALPAVAGLLGASSAVARQAAPTRATTSSVAAAICGPGHQVRIARRGVESRATGRHRWVVKRTHAWLAAFGKLRIRFERQAQTHARLACCVICLRTLVRFC